MEFKLIVLIISWPRVQAQLIDEHVAKGDPVGPLAGLPVAVKVRLKDCD